MSRRHENFSYDYGYKLAPEQWNFYFNGKKINLDNEKRSYLAQLVISGNDKKAEDELKRILRKEEKQYLIIKKCIGFYGKNTSDFYYTKDLAFEPNNLKEALYSYKEWKRYIKSKNNVINSINITSGVLDHNMKMSIVVDEKSENIIDLHKYIFIKLTRNKKDVCFDCTL